MTADELKADAEAAVRRVAHDLVELSHAIHGEAELGFAEHRSAERLVSFLRASGLEAESGICELPTAFRAEFGAGERTVALCAEYDALPAMGHACGHNVIAAASVGATLALRAVADDVDLRVRLLGTPGEEVGDHSGKIPLLERGAFDAVDAALMVHPAPFDVEQPMMIAAALLDVSYTGKASHASSYPEKGVNAADAMTIAQVGIGLLRQHILATDRVHGIVTKGGDAHNIVPAHTTGRFQARSRRLEDLEPLLARVKSCFEAGALATGASVEIAGGTGPYAEVRHDQQLAAAYRRNAERLGRTFGSRDERPSGSTDMGNVSHRIPSIHPFIGIGSWPAVNHQPEFAAAAVSEAADAAVIDGAIALAWTAIDFAMEGTKP